MRSSSWSSSRCKGVGGGLVFHDRLLAHDVFLSAAGAATPVPHPVAQSQGSQGLLESCSALLLTSSAIVYHPSKETTTWRTCPYFICH